jgi:hypothetical protein
MYYPAIPLWSVVLIAAVAFVVSKYLDHVEDTHRGHHLWTPVAGGVSRLIALTFAVLGVIRAVSMLRK